MDERQIKLVFGSLLHDIGKLTYRTGERGTHQESGYEFLKTKAGIEDKDILNSVLYHHAKELGSARLEEDDLAYITYIADNIAAGLDRRSVESAENTNFDRKVPLSSIFNLLNGNTDEKHYPRRRVDLSQSMVIPTDKEIDYDQNFYNLILKDIVDSLSCIEYSSNYISSLLNILEGNLSYIPSSTNKKEAVDISLYDHLKITAAIASCIEQYLREMGETDFKKVLLKKSTEFYKEDAFIFYSLDVSGIQNFIYTIHSEGALKMLRARSFYLEILVEYIIDELLERVGLSRANLIYCGGGHAYLILSNTEDTRLRVDEFEKELNSWFLEKFDISLYIASGYRSCNSYNLGKIADDKFKEDFGGEDYSKNGTYSDLHKDVSRKISMKKSNRYSAEEIEYLNAMDRSGLRECKVCRVEDILIDGRCRFCDSLHNFSRKIMEDDIYFCVVEEDSEGYVELPFSRYLAAKTSDKTKEESRLENIIRIYTKNNIHSGKDVSTNLWVGEHNSGGSFEDLAKNSRGINRIAVLRADVDNLGTAFVSGFDRGGKNNYSTLSRNATLSRQLSLFFKGYINVILSNGDMSLYELEGKKNRKVVIVYSGGDDVFLVGGWEDVISSAIDIRNYLRKYSQNTLSISAGIGLYKHDFPINIMAKDVELLESLSKSIDGKDAVTIFDENHSYKWDAFETRVLGEKLGVLKEFFANLLIDDEVDKMQVENDRGKNFLYNILNLLRMVFDENVNDEYLKGVKSGQVKRTRLKKNSEFVRYVYQLSRMEPGKDASSLEKDKYKLFSDKMFEWANNLDDIRELITAIYIFLYMVREGGSHE